MRCPRVRRKREKRRLGKECLVRRGGTKPVLAYKAKGPV